jgi:putative hemolysin
VQLISTDDVVKAGNLSRLGGENMAKIVMSLLKIDRINQVYAKNESKTGIDFISSTLNDLGINYDFELADLKKIPKEGPFIIVANHPFGGIEGLILMHRILTIRPDFKLIANFLLQRIEPLKGMVFAVNPFETLKNVRSSYSGLRHGFEHVKNGHPLGIFPSGEVSTYQQEGAGITDRPWRMSVIKLIKMASVPVVPVYFHGKNSTAFYFLGRIHPMLRTVKIPSEMLNKRNVKIKMRIGNSISVEEQSYIEDIHKFAKCLRDSTDSLANIPVQKENSKINGKKHEKIVQPVNKSLLLGDINNLPDKQLLFRWQEYSIYCSPTTHIPNIAREIGRLREITFREVGEGTSLSSDLDEFDSYYHQLFVWNERENEIVGGYRLGKGQDILMERGMTGFYISTLFRIGTEMESKLGESIELGRSFVIKKYQKTPWSLYLLWKGIFYFLQNNRQYRYLIGPISISNSYSEISKHVMVEFIRKNYFNADMSNSFTPRTPYFYRNGSSEVISLLRSATDINALEKVIEEVETLGVRMPVLLKKYLLLGGKVAGFNIDPGFNHCLDCLLILDVGDVPESMMSYLSK